MINTYLNSLFTLVFAKIFSTTSFDYSLCLVGKPLLLVNLTTILSVLKFSTAFRLSTLVELTAYDFPNQSQRFTYNLFLLSVEYNYRLSINLNLSQTDFLHSLSTVYPNSNWSEREVREMFGLYFTNNSDLRRLLTDYGFEGFPLRKDFPLTGYFEVRYDDELQQILYEPVQLSQEYRIFSLSSPWEKKIINV